MQLLGECQRPDESSYRGKYVGKAVYTGKGCEYGVEHQFQQYFSYIVAVSSIGGVIRFNRRKPPIRRKSLTSWIPLSCTNTYRHELDSNSQL
jgi:hypothetical protein